MYSYKTNIITLPSRSSQMSKFLCLTFFFSFNIFKTSLIQSKVKVYLLDFKTKFVQKTGYPHFSTKCHNLINSSLIFFCDKSRIISSRRSNCRNINRCLTQGISLRFSIFVSESFYNFKYPDMGLIIFKAISTT